jgi:polyisoprenoid-binding protein YceI
MIQRRSRIFPIRRGAISIAALFVLGTWFAGTAHSDPERAASESLGSIEFIGENVFSTARGRFHDWRIVESQVDLTHPEGGYAVVAVELASVDTANERRDEHLRHADFFDVEVHPTATVRGHSLVASEPSDEGNRRFEAQFEIDLHGVQRSVAGTVEVVSEDPMIVEGDLVVNRLDFAVGPPTSRWNPMSIRAEIPIHFRLQI